VENLAYFSYEGEELCAGCIKLAPAGSWEPSKSLLAGQDAVVPGTSLAAVDTGLANPVGQAAGVQAEMITT